MKSETGKRIKLLRNEKQLSMDMLIDDINSKYPGAKIEKSQLSRWENEINEPSLSCVRYLSMYFDVNSDYLMGLTDIRTSLGLSSEKKWKSRQEEIRQTIRENLISCREEKGLTQRELAKIINSKPTTVASWEQGISLPSVDMLYRLSKLYEKSMNYMYGEEQ